MPPGQLCKRLGLSRLNAIKLLILCCMVNLKFFLGGWGVLFGFGLNFRVLWLTKIQFLGNELVKLCYIVGNFMYSI